MTFVAQFDIPYCQALWTNRFCDIWGCHAHQCFWLAYTCIKKRSIHSFCVLLHVPDDGLWFENNFKRPGALTRTLTSGGDSGGPRLSAPVNAFYQACNLWELSCLRAGYFLTNRFNCAFSSRRIEHQGRWEFLTGSSWHWCVWASRSKDNIS